MVQPISGVKVNSGAFCVSRRLSGSVSSKALRIAKSGAAWLPDGSHIRRSGPTYRCTPGNTGGRRATTSVTRWHPDARVPAVQRRPTEHPPKWYKLTERPTGLRPDWHWCGLPDRCRLPSRLLGARSTLEDHVFHLPISQELRDQAVLFRVPGGTNVAVKGQYKGPLMAGLSDVMKAHKFRSDSGFMVMPSSGPDILRCWMRLQYR